MPIPGVLGLFVLPCANDTLAQGCFASFLPRAGCGLEGCIMLSEPAPAAVGEQWFRPTEAFPGGSVAVSALRVLFALPGLSGGATLGVSLAERSPPGTFTHLHFSLQCNDIRAAALFGRTDRTYRGPDGSGFEDAARIAGSFGIVRPTGSATLACSMTLGQPGFAPRPFLASKEVIDITLEKALAVPDGFTLCGQAEAEKRINRDELGAREEAGRYSACLRASAGGLEAATGAGFSNPGGIDLSLSGAFPLMGPRLSFETRIKRLWWGCPAVTTIVALRLADEDSALSVESGIQDCPVSFEAKDVAKRFKLKVSWTARSTAAQNPRSTAAQ
jgi:hypothetical protein